MLFSPGEPRIQDTYRSSKMNDRSQTRQQSALLIENQVTNRGHGQPGQVAAGLQKRNAPPLHRIPA